jgi:hypothetical protein
MRLAQILRNVTRANTEKPDMTNRRLQIDLRNAVTRLLGMGYEIDRDRMTLTRGRSVVEYGRGILIRS